MDLHLDSGGFTSYTDFLQQGIEVPFASSQLDEQSFMNNDVQECASNKKRGCNFTTGEDNLLVSSWLNNSLDAADGHNKKSEAFWKRIQNYYMEGKKQDWQDRTVSSLCHRFSGIQKAVNKFCSYLSRIESMHRSGVSNEDNIRDARKLYNSIEKHQFRYDHCWALLKNEQKWLDREPTVVPSKRKSATPRPEPTLVSADTTNDLSMENNSERPIGRKAAKERKKLGKGILGDASISASITELKEEKKKSHDDKMASHAQSVQSNTDQRGELLEIQKLQYLEAKEGNRIKIKKLDFIQRTETEKLNFMQRKEREKMRFLQSKEDMKIMMQDTSSMTPEQKEYIKMCRMEITRRNIDLN